MTLKKAAMWVAFWVVLALIFNAGIYYFQGPQKGMEFLTGYLIEKSLSMDNLFVFLMVFSYFNIPAEYQRRVLFYGIAGALVLRLVMIMAGVTLVEQFHWILYIFGALLIITSYKFIFDKDETISLDDNKAVNLFKRIMPVTKEFHGEKFFVRIKGAMHATPLFLALLVIESSDVMFAIDSIPAIFAITTDPFIVYTSNIFAILGLRSLYFFLERVQEIFIYVKKGVGVLLFVTGLKLILLMFGIKVPTEIALSIVGSILGISILASVLVMRKSKTQEVKEKSK